MLWYSGIRLRAGHRGRAGITAPQGFDFLLLPRLQLRQYFARRDHVGMFVREAQQHVVESRLRLLDARSRVLRRLGSGTPRRS